MIRNTDEDWLYVNPVHLVNPVYASFILVCKIQSLSKPRNPLAA